MPWIKAYNVEHDMMFQTEISQTTAWNIKAIAGLDGVRIEAEKFEGIAVRPREYYEWPENIRASDA